MESSKRFVLWIAQNDSIARPRGLPSGMELLVCKSVAQAAPLLSQSGLILCDAGDAETAERSLHALRQMRPAAPVVVRVPGIGAEVALRLVKAGAADVIADESLNPEHLEALFREPVRDRLFVGESAAMRNIAQVIRLIAARRCTILLTGETGTGKEVVARAVHRAGNRAAQEFVAINCSALPEHLLEAELFGHVKGAFTGAIHHRTGLLEKADRGTLFLDEIGDMPLNLQAKLLRTLQEREVQRLGSSETVRLDIRVIAATNADLPERIRQGRFREDLYYRLNVVPVELPPLRQRPEDIPALAQHFIEKFCAEEGLERPMLTPEALRHLAAYYWPGNVRQLENAVAMAVALSGGRRWLGAEDFASVPSTPETLAAEPCLELPREGLDFERTVGNIERGILTQALQRTGGNKKMAAEMLGLKRTTLSAKLRSLAVAAVC